MAKASKSQNTEAEVKPKTAKSAKKPIVESKRTPKSKPEPEPESEPEIQQVEDSEDDETDGTDETEIKVPKVSKPRTIYHNSKGEVIKKVGTREEVWDEKAHQTSGGLKKDDLFRKNGRLVSKNASERGKQVFAMNSDKMLDGLQKKLGVKSVQQSNAGLKGGMIAKIETELPEPLPLKKQQSVIIKRAAKPARH